MSAGSLRGLGAGQFRGRIKDTKALRAGYRQDAVSDYIILRTRRVKRDQATR